MSVKDTFWVHPVDDIITTEKHRSSPAEVEALEKEEDEVQTSSSDPAEGQRTSRSPPPSRSGFKQAADLRTHLQTKTCAVQSQSLVSMSGNVTVWGGGIKFTVWLASIAGISQAAEGVAPRTFFYFLIYSSGNKSSLNLLFCFINTDKKQKIVSQEASNTRRGYF